MLLEADVMTGQPTPESNPCSQVRVNNEGDSEIPTCASALYKFGSPVPQRMRLSGVLVAEMNLGGLNLPRRMRSEG